MPLAASPSSAAKSRDPRERAGRSVWSAGPPPLRSSSFLPANVPRARSRTRRCCLPAVRGSPRTRPRPDRNCRTGRSNRRGRILGRPDGAGGDRDDGVNSEPHQFRAQPGTGRACPPRIALHDEILAFDVAQLAQGGGIKIARSSVSAGAGAKGKRIAQNGTPGPLVALRRRAAGEEGSGQSTEERASSAWAPVLAALAERTERAASGRTYTRTAASGLRFAFASLATAGRSSFT